jgi:hypothetical protein
MGLKEGREGGERERERERERRGGEFSWPHSENKNDHFFVSIGSYS